MKPALLRPQAQRDREWQVRYYREAASPRIARAVVKATGSALDQLERDPGIGSLRLGEEIAVSGLRTWRVARFPLLWFYFEFADHLDVVRLLGERQDVAALLKDAS